MPTPLRLTLRTLLSYLDDTLDPTQAKAIGQKVAESDQARELMERIKQVTRRRRLTTPPAAGPGGIDANTIAEYMDNEVTPEQAAEVEQICLASDVHLAEVAACHQILTLVLGEPALVPPSAKQRMYGLVKGAGTKADLDLSTSDMGHGDETLAPSVFKNAGSRNTLLLAGGGLIAACLLVVALWQLFRTPHNGDVDQPRRDQLAQADAAKKDKDADDKKPIADDKKSIADDKKPDDKKDKEKKPDVEKDKDDTKDRKDKSPMPEVKAPVNTDELAFGPPELKPAILGQYEPDLKLPDVLLQKGSKAGWERFAGKTLDVTSGRPLLTLPGMKSEIELKKNVHLTLWGTAPEIWPPNQLIYESMVELYAHDVLDLDMALKRGRIILANARSTARPVTVRVRFENPTQQKQAYFDITLKDNTTAVAIERMCAFPQNEPFFEDPAHPNRQGPNADMLCFFLGGSAFIRTADVGFSVDATTQPQWVTWNSSKGIDSPRPFVLPDWILPTPKFSDPKERQTALQAAANLARNVQAKKLDVALQEALGADDLAARRLALRCYTAQDDFSKPLEMLDQENIRDGMRRYAIYSLRYWMAQERDNEYQLYDALRAQSNKIVAKKIMELLHGISTTDAGMPATWQRLIDDLDNEVVALRELSAWNLEVLVPAGRKYNYSASANQGARRFAQSQWRQLIPPGALPPAPKKQ